jgi:hypothetical protein
VHRKHIALGAQENRVEKYHDEDFYTTLAVLDFGLDEAQAARLVGEALELVANRAKYSMRELIGTLIALREPELRARENLLSREQSLYCSAFVRQAFRKIGSELAPGVSAKNTTPEDIARSPLVRTAYILKRDLEPGKLARLKTKLKKRLGDRVERLRELRATLHRKD